MLTNLKKRNEGFTIIEVLIVLAIAGLILLVVFLAVPNLQRNSRNNQRKADVSNLLGGVGEYVSNNNGAVPATAANLGSGTTATIGASGANQVPVKLGFYDASKVSIGSGAAAVTNPNDTEKVVIVVGGKCNGGDSAPGSSRQYVALYTAENNAKLCIES